MYAKLKEEIAKSEKRLRILRNHETLKTVAPSDAMVFELGRLKGLRTAFEIAKPKKEI